MTSEDDLVLNFLIPIIELSKKKVLTCLAKLFIS